MARVMYFDCFSGAAGDMMLAALIDAGLPVEVLRDALGSLGVGHTIDVSRVTRAGISATYVHVREAGSAGHDPEPHDHAHAHQHDHGHGHRRDHGRAHSHTPTHGHRTLREIAGLIEQSALSAAGKARAVALFQRIGEAEAAIHNMSIDEVHLHEVGALDSIIDIVGAVFALEWFGIEDIVSSPMNVGAGTVEMAHGAFPVPAPATLRLLSGAPVYSSGVPAELVTPTGALLVTSYARSYGPLPAMVVDRIGYGAGTRDFSHTPNVLRVVIGERRAAAEPAAVAGTESIVKIECEIDDMNPQLFGPVSDGLFAAGALDVFLTSVQMKKGRPGTLLTVLSPEAARERLTDLVFRETTTLGVRFQTMQRETLERRWESVAIVGGSVRIKVASRCGEVLGATPEFDDCLRLATATGRPVKSIQAEAMQAWLKGAPAR